MTRTLPRPSSRLQVESLEDRLAPTADLVIQWNDAAREAIRTANTSANMGSRILAITQAAVYDSVNALDRTHEVYLVDALANPKASREAAVAAASGLRRTGIPPFFAGLPFFRPVGCSTRPENALSGATLPLWRNW